MNSLYKSLWFILLLFLYSCVTPQSTFRLSQSENINLYRYVYIIPLKYDDIEADKFGVIAHIEELFLSEGLIIVTQSKFNEMSPDERSRVLFCEIQHFHTSDKMRGTYANLTIELTNDLNEKVYIGKGIYKGFTVRDDLIGAAKEAFKGFSKLYSGFDPSLSLKDRFNKWEMIDKSKSTLIEYFDSNHQTLNPIEGIWTAVEDNAYQIGIFKDNEPNGRDFVAIILQSNNPYWYPKQVKIEFQKTVFDKIYITYYYMLNHSKQVAISYVNEYGLLEIKLNNPDGTPLKRSFIKNPSNLNEIRTDSFLLIRGNNWEYLT